MEYLQVNQNLITQNVATLLSVGKTLASEGHSVFVPKTHKPLFIVVVDNINKTKRTILFDEITYSWGLNTPKNKIDVPQNTNAETLLKATLENFNRSIQITESDLSTFKKAYKEIKC